MAYTLSFVNENEIIVSFHYDNLETAKTWFARIKRPAVIFDADDRIVVRNHVNDAALEHHLGIEVELMLVVSWLDNGQKKSRSMWAAEADAAFEKLQQMGYPCFTSKDGQLLRKANC